MTSASLHPAPLGEINTTPLIDVMLVLLVMMVISIPAATHSLDVDLPNCGAQCPSVPVDQTRNLVTLGGDDRIRWNGAEVTAEGLSGLLARSRSLQTEPELQFEPAAAASYDAAAHVVAVIKASGVTNFGFIGNERFRDFAR